MLTYDKVYIDGQWVASTGAGTLDVYDSTNGSVFGSVPEGTREDLDAAVAAAARAFDDWAGRATQDRAKHCARIAEGLQARAQEIAEVITRESGMPMWLSTLAQAGLPVNDFAQ